MKRSRFIRCSFAFALAGSALAAPGRISAQDQDPVVAAAANHRLTAAEFQKFADATRGLAALARKDPSAVTFAGTLRPEAARVFASSGMSKDEWLVFAIAMFDAYALVKATDLDPEGTAELDVPGMVKANASFVRKNLEAVEALGPDIKLLQSIGEGS